MPTPTLTLLKVPAAALPEYARRHHEMWPELRDAIRERGGSNMSIFAAPDSDTVVLYVEVEDFAEWRMGAESALTQRWWRYMAEIMPTRDDSSPISKSLELIFQLH